MDTPPSPPDRLVLVSFRVDELRYAVPLATVERVVHAVALTPLPGGPPVLMGAMDLGGQPLPVLSLRPRLRRPGRELRSSDHFLVLRTSRRTLALMADEVLDVAAFATPSPLPADADACLHGVAIEGGGGEGLLLILDMEAFLGADDQQRIDTLMSRSG